MPKILDENTNHITLKTDDGKVITVSNDDYYHLKYDMVNVDKRDVTGRIYHEFNDISDKIHETYNNKIFNLMFNDVVIQSRQEEANKVCKFILNDDIDYYLEYCHSRYQVINCQEIVKKLLCIYNNRIDYTKRGIIIDKIFKVGYDGSAHVKIYGSKWKSLCLVADGYIRDKQIDTAIGRVNMSRTLQTILAKIGFCLKPDDKDIVFMQQLPNKLQRVIRDEANQRRKEEAMRVPSYEL